MKPAKPPSLDCPGCGISIVWSDDYPHRPFCSKRCREADFIDWANEDQRIAGSSSYDDIFSEILDKDEI